MKWDQVLVYSAELCKMRQVVLQSMWSRVVPPKAHCPERFLCLRDICHEEVPEGVSFHFLKLACFENAQVFYLLGCSCVTTQRTFTTKRKWPYSLSSHLLRVNTKLTLIENKKEKVLKQSWSLWLRFRAQGNLKAWNVELERIWCVSNWMEGDNVSGVCTFRHYLSNVLWHVWSIGRQGHRNEGFMQTPLQFYLPSPVWVHALWSKNTSRHTTRFGSYRVCVWAIWIFTLNNI